MRTAREMCRRGMEAQLWSEIETCSTEETTDPLTILAVDNLYHKVRDRDGKIAKDSGIAERCAIVAAYLLAVAPKNRIVDDCVVLERLGVANEEVEKFLSNDGQLAPKPEEAPHKGRKQGREGDLHFAKVGSKTVGRDELYTDFRLKFDEKMSGLADSET